MKKLIFAVAIALGLFGSLASAQTVTGTNLWKLVSGNTLVPVVSGWKVGNSATNGAFNNLTITGTCSGCGGGGSQTPWASNIDASYLNLNHAGTVNATNLVATSSISVGSSGVFDQFIDANGYYNIAPTASHATPSITVTTAGSGSVGIGSSSPFAKFAIQANNGDTNRTLFAIGSSTQIATSTFFSIGNTGTVYLAGNVGVETTSPSYILHVEKDSNNTNQMTVGNYTAGSGSASGIRVETNGNAGGSINSFSGSFTSAAESIANSFQIRSFSATTGGVVVAAGGSNPITFWTNSGLRLSILSGGNVGIGTSTPIANFSVSGGAATTTLDFGNGATLKGSCLKLYRTDGTPIYAYVAAGATAFTLTTTACATVAGF